MDANELNCVIKRSDWDALSEEEKRKLKEKLPYVEVVNDDYLENIASYHIVSSASERLELPKVLPIDPYYQQQRSYEREQMRNRTRYMNKHQRYPKK